MADQSDIAKAIWDGLIAPSQTEPPKAGPIVDGWSLVVSPDERQIAVCGVASGSDRFPDGCRIRTSELVAVDVQRRFVATRNTVYRLGWPERVTMEADAHYVWPPALGVAACANWRAAIDDAVHFMGDHSIPDQLLTDLTASIEGGWSRRRWVCRLIAEMARAAGRRAVAEAWALLGADLRNTTDRMAGAMFVTAAGKSAGWTHERDLTVDESLAESGWRTLGEMTDATVEGLGVPVNDPIAAAHKVALLSLRPTGIPQKIDLEPEADDVLVDGVVVLKAIGGIDTQWSGREVVKVFAPITGKRLAVTSVPDVPAARRALAAEFPYAQAAIDVLLGDMAGVASARFRPTILVGPPGNGKSRLARRIGEVSGLHVVRFDGAGASDSAFGGTPRRWSTGEPSVPVAALLAARKADALVLIDEIDKAGTGRHNGNFANSLLPLLEAETARCFPDPYAQCEVDVSRVSYIATANDELLLPGPLRDRFRLLRIPAPTAEDLPALCRGIVADLIRESGSDPAWTPPLDGDELWMAQELWKAGSVRRLRDIVARIVVRRAEARH